MKIHWQQRITPLSSAVRTLLVIVLAIWLLEALDWLFPGRWLDQQGVIPRTWSGLRGIAIAPWLHGNFGHLAANTGPFLVLGGFVMLRGQRTFWAVTVIAALISGLGIWLFGSATSVHIGLSGVIFGYLGYLLGRGIFERSVQAISLALLAGFLYGGMIWGVLPLSAQVSWLGHLFGLFGGLLAARIVQ